MENIKIRDSVKEILIKVLKVSSEKITDDLTMKDLDAWDSLNHMELIISLEETFGIQLTFDEIVAMQSIQEIRRILRARGAIN